jgi:hypothetical protein
MESVSTGLSRDAIIIQAKTVGVNPPDSNDFIEVSWLLLLLLKLFGCFG